MGRHDIVFTQQRGRQCQFNKIGNIRPPLQFLETGHRNHLGARRRVNQESAIPNNFPCLGDKNGF